LFHQRREGGIDFPFTVRANDQKLAAERGSVERTRPCPT
jgi:hypothetical protein